MGRRLERWLPLVVIVGVMAQVLSLLLQVVELVWRPGTDSGSGVGAELSEVDGRDSPLGRRSQRTSSQKRPHKENRNLQENRNPEER